MFKLKVIKKVGDIETIVEVETDSTDMVVAILRHNDVISIDSDAPNRNVDKDWINLIDKLNKAPGIVSPPYTVTC